MKNLNINFKHCYGIKKLNYEFEFSNRTFAIYAPNGVMKTSFARAFDDLATGSETKDLAFPHRETVAEFTADNEEVSSESVFVIQSYNANFKSEKISTLLANQDLKNSYDNVHKEINKALASFTKSMKEYSGVSGKKETIESVIEKVFGSDFYTSLLNLKQDVSDSQPLPYSNIQYNEIFNDKVKSFLETKDFKTLIQDFIEKYDQLVEQSPILRNKFKFHHAESIQQELLSNHFFDAGHSVNLFDGEKKNEYESNESFQAVLEEEKKKIFNDEDLQTTYSEISKKLTNKELKQFRDYLLQNKEILPELNDLDSLAKKLWSSYFVAKKEAFLELVTKYEDGQKEIRELVAKASDEKTDWEEVIRIFNTRFSHLPFQLVVRNKEDVILKSDVESIDFVFKEGEDERVFEAKDELLKILSTGEQRALYILNIIFEVEARKKEDRETIFVIDDVADSFDYKNKYAIIEYLKYMSDIDKFYLLILTHNFDFYRTIQSRKVVFYSQCLIALKNDGGVLLEPMQYLNNPFINDWKNNLSDNKKLIASIPFVRNIIEYTKGNENEEFLKLTSVLHFKEETNDIVLSTIKTIFENNIQGINFPSDNLTGKIIDLIFTTADDCLNANKGINLENKIVMSIAIRILAERFMFDQITDEDFLKGVGTNQNWKLLKRYSDEFNNEVEKIELLKRVNLMTPENIHVNSFMYEPILDMGDNELRELYTQAKKELAI